MPDAADSASPLPGHRMGRLSGVVDNAPHHPAAAVRVLFRDLDPAWNLMARAGDALAPKRRRGRAANRR
ncbi:hypothetical protein [Micromonospora sp. CPCC 206061]|uniref:hypothetical protein n=1 Tax=Micromonospora sp. CPCC 206061 TaxID=3122410 RepID=UPI002FF0F380